MDATVEGHTTSTEISFEAPGPGSWMLDTTHHGRRPVTRYLEPLYRESFAEGMPVLLERYGLPLEGFRTASVNGCIYLRPMAIGEPDRPGREPPVLLLKVVSRLHPKLRRRNRTARQAWAERRWRQDVDRWFDVDRDQIVAANLALQAVEVDGLGDEELLAHLTELTAAMRRRAVESFETHGGDIVPVGDFMAHCRCWGIDLGVAADLLRGSSPATTETATILAPVAVALEAASSPPASVAAVRALGPEADAAVTTWLELHGWRLIASDDVDSPTLNERPELQLRALLAATSLEPAPPTTAEAEVRARVPPADQSRFDEVLAEARYGLRMRDDNVGVRWNWPAGLLRRALLEVGRRLAVRGALAEPVQVLELAAAEVASLLTGGTTPNRAEVADRWRRRQAVITSEPPRYLGPESPPPPLEAFPAPLARATAAVLAMIDAMEGEPAAEPLHGSGVGTGAATGRALVVASAHEALDRLEHGDIVIAPYTGPSWNSLLPMIGALVVEEGGPICHAAIVAREFGIPAVVGVRDATRLVPDGATVEVDAAAGRLRVLD